MSEQATVGLDDVDRSLIEALIADGRSTYAALAPRVGLSQAAVRTRVQRLLDEHIIVVTGRVDPTAFGLGVFAFAFLEVAREVDKVAALVAEIDEVVFIAVGAGRYELLVELRCRDDDALLDALDRLRVVDGVRRLQSVRVLHYDKQDWTSIGNREGDTSPQPMSAPSTEIDEIDRELLLALMADGRASFATLAPVVGLSQAAVRDRVLNLIDSKVVTIQAHPVPEAMGIGGFSGIVVKASGPVAPLAQAMVELPESCLVARTLGRFDVVAEIWFDDDDHLADVLDRLRALDGVGSVDTVPYMRIALEEFRPGASRNTIHDPRQP